MTAAQSAGIVTKNVRTVGNGISRPDAIENALTQAVGQISGLSIKTQTKSSSVTSAIASVEENGGKRTESSESLVADDSLTQTQTKTQGHVKSYSVVNVSPNPDGTLQAVVDVDVTIWQGDAQSDRKRIAVLPFRYKGNTEIVRDFDNLLRQAVTDYLTGTRHFSVIDKDFNDERLGELASLLNPDVKVEERSRIGNTLGTDYILVGNINNFQLKAQKTFDPYTKEPTESIVGVVQVTYRLIEAASGQIVASNSFDKKIKTQKIHDVLKEGTAQGMAVGAQITDIIYPLMVVAYNDGHVTLAQGGNTVKVGTRYKLIKYGKVLTDPYTQEPLARDEIQVGEVEISDVSPKISHAVVLNSKVKLDDLAPREYILRAAPEKESQGAKTQKPKTQQPKW